MKRRTFSSLRTRALAVSLAGFLVLASASPLAEGCATSTGAVDSTVKCTPGSYVYCRCKNREEGTKLCKEDGRSFDVCDPCESPDNPVEPTDPNNPPPEVDASTDRVVPPSASCGDKVVQDGEDCDDGNAIEDDGCDSTCKLAGTNPAATRSCPGLDVHVWSKPVSYVGTTQGSTNTGSAKPTCPGTGAGNPTTGAAASDRVFRVFAHKTGQMTVTTSDTSYDSFLYVTTACTPGANGELGYLACKNEVNGVGGETLQFPVTAGKSYSVIVDGAGISQQQGAFRVTFAVAP
jgi:cysteine-rich repeat protein